MTGFSRGFPTTPAAAHPAARRPPAGRPGRGPSWLALALVLAPAVGVAAGPAPLSAADAPPRVPAVRRATAVVAAVSAPAEPVYSVEDCVRLTCQLNPGVLAANREIDAARGTVTAAKAGFIPALNVSASYLKRQGSFVKGLSQDVFRRKEDYAAEGRVTQTLYSSGRVRAQVDIAKKNQLVQSLSYQSTLEAAVDQTRETFALVLLAEATVRVRREAVTLLEQQLRDQQTRFASGQSSQVNVTRAQVSLANERPNLIEAEGNLQTYYVQLAEAMGVPFAPGRTHPPFRIRGTLERRAFVPSLEDCLNRAENQRPELASRQVEIQSANRQVTVDRATTLPRVDAYAAYQLFSEPSLLATRDYYNGYTFGLNVTWEVFDGFASLGRVRSDRAKILGANDKLRETRLVVQGAVRTAYESLRQAEVALANEAGDVRLAEESLRLVTNNVDAGLSTQLEQLQSRLDLTRAQLTRLNTWYQYQLAWAKLQRAMGETAPAVSGGPAPVAAAAPGPASSKDPIPPRPAAAGAPPAGGGRHGGGPGTPFE